jgi:ribonuclease BN (tRNA processing enzyme)
MKKKKLSGYVMVGALSVGIIGGVGTSAFATTSLETDTVKQTVGSLDATTQEKVQTIKEELKAQLAKLGVTLPERGEKGERFANLDDETKAKAEAIIEKEKAGTITHEEAKAELQELGVTLPERGEKGDRFANLDDETKAKAEAIVEKEKAGTITHEEAKAQLQELGVTLPEHEGKGKKADIFANLDDETKAKAQELMDNAKAELEELGVKHPGMKNN